MNHFTNFFTKLKEYFKDVDVTFRIKEKNDRYTVMVLPEIANSNGLKPLTITGTMKELDDDFFGKLQEAIIVTEGLSSNIDEVKKDAADLAASAATKATAKTATTPQKEKPAKEKTSKKKEKPTGKSKPKPTESPAHEQRDIFSQAPPEEHTANDAPDPAPEETEEETPEEEVQETATDDGEATDDGQPK